MAGANPAGVIMDSSGSWGVEFSFSNMNMYSTSKKTSHERAVQRPSRFRSPPVQLPFHFLTVLLSVYATVFFCVQRGVRNSTVRIRVVLS